MGVPSEGNKKDNSAKEQYSFFGKTKNITPDYFAGRVKRNLFKDYLGMMVKRKKLVFACLIIIVLTISIVITFFIMNSHDNTSQKSNTISDSTWIEYLSDMNGEAYQVLNNPDSNSAYSDAINYYNRQIENTNDESRKADITILLANFMTYNSGQGGANTAASILSEINETTLSDHQKFNLYSAFLFAYQVLENEELIAEYEDKINTLPKDITTIGGPADE